MAIIIALILIALFPFIVRGFFAFIGFAVVVLIVGAALSAKAQTQRTTCYDSGNTRICNTYDSMGNSISTTRCYQSGRDQRCETTSSSSSSSSSSTTVIPLPGNTMPNSQPGQRSR